MCERIRPTMIACWVSNRPRRASPSAGSSRRSFPSAERGQDLGIGGAGDQRCEQRAAGLPEQVRRDAVELDAGVRHDPVQASGLALAVTDLGLAITGEVRGVSS